MSITERLAIFYERLRSAPPAMDAERAFALICRTLEAVEADFCPVPPHHPAPKTFDGRMYVPQADSIEFLEDGSWWVETRRHRIAIEGNGSFRIYRVVDEANLMEEFCKKGATA